MLTTVCVVWRKRFVIERERDLYTETDIYQQKLTVPVDLSIVFTRSWQI